MDGAYIYYYYYYSYYYYYYSPLNPPLSSRSYSITVSRHTSAIRLTSSNSSSYGGDE